MKYLLETKDFYLKTMKDILVTTEDIVTIETINHSVIEGRVIEVTPSKQLILDTSIRFHEDSYKIYLHDIRTMEVTNEKETENEEFKLECV